MTHTSPAILDGSSLTPERLETLAQGVAPINLSGDAWAKMKASRRLIDNAVENHIPVYGVTTGLGARVGDVPDIEALAAFSWQTIRGRAHAVGDKISREVVRAGMIVRINTFASGAAGVSPDLAQHVIDCLNADLTPLCGETGSIGAGDLVWNATVALALIGEGGMVDGDGNTGSGADLMKAAGIKLPTLGPRDGLALCNNASHSAALSGLAYAAALRAYHAAQLAAALTMEGFQANLSPLDPRVLALRPQPGQVEAASELRALLDGGPLFEPGAARRLQDPLSIRNLAQLHGAVHAALAFAREAVTMEINGSSDNPVVLIKDKEIVSAGAYHTPHLSVAMETVSRSFVHQSMSQLARLSKMLSDRFTDLPLFLARPGSTSNGFAPVMKTAEALVSELAHSAQPVPIWPSINADGVEDSMTAAPTAAKALSYVASRSYFLTAIEMLVAVEAIEQRGVVDRLGPVLRNAFDTIRKIAPPLEEDRPRTDEIDVMATCIREGRLGM